MKKWQSVMISTKRHYSHIGRLHKKAQSLIRHSALGSLGPRVLGSVRKTCMIPRSRVSAPPDSRFLSENRSVLSARAQSSKSSTGWISLYLLIRSAYI
jgi:hypothetical protein